MCLQDLLIKNTVTNKITRQGLKVYKVVEVCNGKYYPPYMNEAQRHPYSGKMEAHQIPVLTVKGEKNGRKEYQSGFHLFMKFASAKRLCEARRTFTGKRFKVITAIVKKSWITKVGYEYAWKCFGVRDSTKLETIIVAKKAIFPTYRS